ncbi:hypothetical protein KKF84_09190 [Myxococcota bacterium]|nr:hypothetical protein [Myxococcota bacterium]
MSPHSKVSQSYNGAQKARVSVLTGGMDPMVVKNKTKQLILHIRHRELKAHKLDACGFSST